MGRKRFRPGFTLAEVAITILIMAIVSLGVMHFQFHAVKDAKMARTKISATRLGSLILENWKTWGGSEQYDPTDLDFGINWEGENRYSFIVDDVPFYMDLKAQDIDTNHKTEVTLRQLEVSIQWRSDYEQGLPDNSDPGFTLYTYVRRDQSGG